MSRAGDAGAACATWTIRLFEDVTLVRSMWRLLRAARDPSPFMRVKLASAQAMVAALMVEDGPAHNARPDGGESGTCRSLISD